MKKFIKIALLSTTAAMLSFGAYAKETVVWWDFLSGGDGVRMKALIEKFNAEHADTIEIQPTTLEWGVPFYSKAQTSAAIGEGPDVMTYHISRLPLGISTGTLAEITPEDLANVGLSSENYATSNWEAGQADGKQYAVPFDIHSIVLYYNKEKLAEVGLIGDDGLPTGLDGADNFNAALQKLKDAGTQYGVAIHSAKDDSQWRIFLGLLAQQGGEFLDSNGEFLSGDNLDKAVKVTDLVRGWVTNSLAPEQTEYAASIALFTSGEAAMHINGVWEVPTFTDLHAKGELFEWGAIQLPTFYDKPGTWADSHSFVIPNNVGKEMTPEKRKAVMEVIAWMNKNSISWANAGHIPAYTPVRESEEFKSMQPNATYSTLADTAVFDPKSVLAGVASPVYDAVGNYMVPAVNGEIDSQQAVEEMRDDLNDQRD